MTTLDIILFSASIASLILAILAIWLSIVFFRMSSELSTISTRAAEGISTSVQKLEVLFDRLYADTFSMMRDTVSDMRKHIWPDDSLVTDKVSQEAEKISDEKINAVKKKMDLEVIKILERQQITNKELTSLKAELQNLLHNAIKESRGIDVEEHDVITMDNILTTMHKYSRHGIKAVDLVNTLRPILRSTAAIFEIEQMKDKKLITYPEPRLEPESIVKLTKKGADIIKKMGI